MGIEQTIPDKTLIITPHRPDFREKFFFFISGIIMSVPFTFFIGTLTDSLCIRVTFYYASVCSTVIFTPIIEEFAKAYPLFYRHGETEKCLVTLGFLVGLGFGISEFLLYIFYLKVSIIFRLPGLLFHAASTSITTYGIANKKATKFYLIAVGLHATNNFFAILGSFWFVGGISAAVIAYILALRLYRQTSERFADNTVLPISYCSCGAEIGPGYQFCKNCGRPIR